MVIAVPVKRTSFMLSSHPFRGCGTVFCCFYWQLWYCSMRGRCSGQKDSAPGIRAEQQCAGGRKVIAIRQIHEQLADVIQVPEELRNRRTEVIFLAIDAAESVTAPVERADTPDFAADLFFGALPDFPERAPQGDFDW